MWDLVKRFHRCHPFGKRGCVPSRVRHPASSRLSGDTTDPSRPPLRSRPPWPPFRDRRTARVPGHPGSRGLRKERSWVGVRNPGSPAGSTREPRPLAALWPVTVVAAGPEARLQGASAPALPQAAPRPHGGPGPVPAAGTAGPGSSRRCRRLPVTLALLRMSVAGRLGGPSPGTSPQTALRTALREPPSCAAHGHRGQRAQCQVEGGPCRPAQAPAPSVKSGSSLS